MTVHQRHLHTVPAPGLLDPVIVRSGDGDDANHGPASRVCQCTVQRHRDGLPVGLGLLNLVTPTFAVVAGALAIGRISLAKWWRFALPLVLILGVVVMLVLSITVIVLG